MTQEMIFRSPRPDSVTEEEIGEFEGVLGMRLPEAYRRFIAKYNGGIPVRAKHRVHDLHIACFYGIKNPVRTALQATRLSPFRLPQYLLVIANESCGCTVVLDLRDDQIFFRDYECELPREQVAISDFTHVARSIDEFLRELE